MRSHHRSVEAAQKLAETVVEFVFALEAELAENARSREATLAGSATNQPIPHWHNPNEPDEVPNGPALRSVREAAAFLGISPRTLWGMSAPRGPIPVVKFGTRALYAEEDLKNGIAKFRRVAAPTESPETLKHEPPAFKAR